VHVNKVLIVEDDPSFREALLRRLKAAGYDGRGAASVREGLLAAQEFEPAVICLDVNLPDGNGVEAVGTFAESPGHPEVLVLTGAATPDGAEQAIRSGAWDYLAKAEALEELDGAIKRAVDYHAQQGLAVPRALDLGKMVGRSPAMKALYDKLAQAASCEAKVLVTGESGTGKELAAWAIHSNSRRREKSFVVVDCAALPEDLVESMLFGHRKGSFTGAVESRVGLVEQADGGTLFLDEVAELPLGVQKAFLRTLQEKRFRPVGGDREVRSDFRLVAATNRDLDQMVAEGTFRADLLFRLRALHIKLPALRERGDDIREIAHDAVNRICDREQGGDGAKGLSPEFLQALARYPWPGNVRELLNACEQAVAAAWNHPALQPVHLPLEVRARVVRAGIAAPQPEPLAERQPFVPAVVHGEPPSGNGEALSPLATLEEHRHASTQHYLEDLLRTTRADVTEACRISGLSRSRFYALLKEHGLARKA
jgi:two-component system NtrC family response regulator